MTICSVRWRPSGGRGEYEVVQAGELTERQISVYLPDLELTIPAEIKISVRNGKPRLRKNDGNDRSKLHLVHLVMALARLPSPAREDRHDGSPWPLEDKGFLVAQMDFVVAELTPSRVTLVPQFARILHSEQGIDLASHFFNIASDIEKISTLLARDDPLAIAIQEHFELIKTGQNTSDIQVAAGKVMQLQKAAFGPSNGAAVSTIKMLPPTYYEENFTAKEGKILVRLHAYRERDRNLVRSAKKKFRDLHGSLFCECCGFDPERFYGERGRGRIDAHHRTPVEELLPDTIVSVGDLAMVCPNCHDVIHSKRPWLTVAALAAEILLKKDEVSTEGISVELIKI